MTHHGEALTRESGDASLAEAVASDRLAGLDARMRALCGYAARLTLASASVSEADLDPLRSAGLDDRAIVDANQVIAYFNYVNRIAHGLGVELEPSWPEAQRIPRHHAPAHDAGSFPVVEAGALPWLTVGQMREVDRIIMDDLGITLERMMENAGRSLALLARHLLGGDSSGRDVRVLAGPGGNGGGGMVAARHLAVAGAMVEVSLGAPAEQFAPVPAEQLAILRKMRVPVAFGAEPSHEPDLVIDALLGYSQVGAPREEMARLIAWTAGHRVLSLDVPSGLELTSGQLFEPHVHAEATLTLALPKEGLQRHVNGAVGELYVGDISVPPSVYEKLGLAFTTPFGRGPIARVAATK